MFARVGLVLILVFFFFACMAGFCGALTSVADTGVVNLNAHFMCLGRSNLDVLDGEGLGGTPGDRSLSNFSIHEVANVCPTTRGFCPTSSTLARSDRAYRAYLASDGLS